VVVVLVPDLVNVIEIQGMVHMIVIIPEEDLPQGDMIRIMITILEEEEEEEVRMVPAVMMIDTERGCIEFTCQTRAREVE